MIKKTLHPAESWLFALTICLVCTACSEPGQETIAPARAQFGARADTAHADWPSSFGFGRPAGPVRIAAGDIDVRPDGKGLPPGSGTVAEGAAVYTQKCAACHGATGTEGPNDRLVGRVSNDGFPFGESLKTWDNKTIGGYWPFATTLYDYIYRAMPQNAPGSLTPNEVYALTAFLLHRNEIISEDGVMSAETLPRVEMPASDRFISDDRLDYQEVH